MTKQEVKILQELANDKKEAMLYYYNLKDWESNKTMCEQVRLMREIFELLGLEWKESDVERFNK